MACKLNEIECFIDGYSVIVQEGLDELNVPDGTVDFVFSDTCKTMRNQCRMKAILVKVAKDWLEDAGSTETVYDAAGCKGEFVHCQVAGSNVAFSYGAKTLTLTTAVPAPVAPVTVFVPLPYECGTNVFTP